MLPIATHNLGGEKMLIETLESRSLMSASAFGTQVQIDRLNVRAALLKFRYDAVTSTATLVADCSALQAADLKQDAHPCAALQGVAQRSKGDAAQHWIWTCSLNRPQF